RCCSSRRSGLARSCGCSASRRAEASRLELERAPRREGGLDQRLDVEALLGLEAVLESSVDHRALGLEHGAAVGLVLDRELEGPDATRELDRLLLVERDQRAQHGELARGLDAAQVLERLARHLTEALAGDDRAGALDAREAPGDALHHAPVEDRAV